MRVPVQGIKKSVQHHDVCTLSPSVAEPGAGVAEIKLPPGAVITASDPAPDPYFFLIKDLNKFIERKVMVN
jgi:hypothetical protein